MSNIKDIRILNETMQEAAEKYANQKWESGYFSSKEEIAKDFLAGSHSIGEEILQQLEDKMPDFENGDTPYDGYRKCIETLRSIINKLSLNNKEGI